MKFTKAKDSTDTVRKVWTDDKSELLGIVGTIKDLMARGIIKRVTNYSFDTWICIPAPGRIERWDGIGATREEAVNKAVFGRLLGSR